MDGSKGDHKLSRGEIVTALAHYYRAEVTRSLSWRERLDRTTNWAVGTTAAFLGFGFSHPDMPHALFLFAFAILYMLLYVESRRYRFYDAYEYRVRLLHQHYIYNVLAKGELAGEGELDSGIYWRAELASDLRYPQYKMGLRQALTRRLRANYIYLFAILAVAWLLKIKLHPQPVSDLSGYLGQAAIGFLPGGLVLAGMLLFLTFLVVIATRDARRAGSRDQTFRAAPRSNSQPPDPSEP